MSPQQRLLTCFLGLAIATGFGARSPTRNASLGGQGSPSSATSGKDDWPRFGFDVSGSNASTAPADIDTTALASLRRQQVQLDGTVDASPIYLHGVQVKGSTHDVFFVTTTYGKTEAIDANDGSVLWKFTPPGYESLAHTPRITNATPVADPGRQFIYAASPDGHVRRLAVSDGRVAWDTAITKLPEREKIAGALNLFDGRIVAVTGGYVGDRAPYQGHVAVLDADNGHLLHAWNSLCSDRPGILDPHSCQASGSAIWGRAGATIDPKTGNIFVATGNGAWNGRTDWGDAVLELDRDATRLVGNYTPTNNEELDKTDMDLGSTSPILLGSGDLAQGGKDGHIRVLGLEQIAGTAPHRGGELQSVPTPSSSGMFTAAAVLHANGDTWLFAADDGGTAGYRFRGGRLQRIWQNQETGTSPVIAGGLLYVYDPGGNGLRVYEPATGRRVGNLECGAGHWNSPIIVDGRIALPEGNANRHETIGVLDIWRSAR